MSSSSGVTAYTWLDFFAFIFEKNSLPIFKGTAFAKQMLLRYENQVFNGNQGHTSPRFSQYLTKDVETTSGEKKIKRSSDNGSDGV